MWLAAGLRPDPLEELKGKKGFGIGMGRKGRARKDMREVVGRYGKEKGGMEMGRKEWKEEGRVREREGAEGEIGYGKGREGSTWIFIQGLPSS